MMPRAPHLWLVVLVGVGCSGSADNRKALPLTTVSAKPSLAKADGDFLVETALTKGNIKDVAFSPDGATIVAASGTVFQGEVRTYDAKTGKPIRSFPDCYGCAAFSADGKLLAAAGKDCLKLWNPTTGNETRTLPGYEAMITRVAFSPNDQSVATTSYDGTVKLWETATGKSLQTLKGPTKAGQSNWVLDLAWSKNGKRLAAAGPSEAVVVWDTQSGKSLQTLQQPAVATSVAISPDMTLLAAIGGTKDQPCEIRLWELESGRPARTLSWGQGAAHCVAFSPDGALLVAANADGHVQSWDTKSWTEQNTFRAHADTIWRLAFAPVGKVFATAGHDGTVRIWDAAKLEAKK